GTQRRAASLLDAERLDTRGELRLDLRPVPLRAAVEEALDYLDAEVTVEIDPDLRVLADPQRLEQILINLVTNALRYGGPPVVLSAAVTDPPGRGQIPHPPP